MSERDLEALILDYINREKGFFCWKNYSMGVFDESIGGFRNRSRFAPKGISDILGIYDGRKQTLGVGGISLAIEVKLPGNTPTMEQMGFIKKINLMGGSAAWVTSLDGAERFVKKVRLSHGLAERK